MDLHSRDCRPVVVMWRPFHYCIFSLQTPVEHQDLSSGCLWDFLQMFSTVVDFMTSSKVWSGNHTTSFHIYADGTERFFKKGHLPFAVLSLFLYTTFL